MPLMLRDIWQRLNKPRYMDRFGRVWQFDYLCAWEWFSEQPMTKRPTWQCPKCLHLGAGGRM